MSRTVDRSQSQPSIDDWLAAKERLVEVTNDYLNLVGFPGVNVDFVLLGTLIPLRRRYNSGERSWNLYDSIMGIR